MRYLICIFLIVIVESGYSQAKELSFESLKDTVLSQDQLDFRIFKYNKLDTDFAKGWNKYKIHSITYKDDFIGDFNKNGIADVFAKMELSYSKSSNYRIYGLVELLENKIKIVEYFVDNNSLEINYDSIKVSNDTIEMANTIKYSSYNHSITMIGDKIQKTSIAYDDAINGFKIVSPCKFDEMVNTNIFKDSIHVKRALGINGLLTKEQNEVFEDDRRLIKIWLSGCDGLILKTRIVFKKEGINWENETIKSLEFLQTNTRFRTIYTRIEKKILSMDAEGKIKYTRAPYIVNSNERFELNRFKMLNGKEYSIEFTYYIVGK